MAKHTISLSEFQDYNFTYQLTGYFGDGISKSLQARISLKHGAVSYKVLSHGKIMVDTADIEKAIDCYNDI